MGAGAIAVRKTLGASVLLWFRNDLPREQVRAHWRGPHAQLVARQPALRDYRQHHFAATGAGLWPAIDGVETTIPNARRVDGMPEVAIKSVMATLRPNPQIPLIFADEANVFARTILYTCGPGQGRWHDLRSRGRVGSRCVTLMRRRADVKPRSFARFVYRLGTALAENDLVRELNTQVFMPWKESNWATPGVAHDNPESEAFHASMVLGFADEAARAAFFAADVLAALATDMATHCEAVHAYPVEETHIYVKDGRVTLPQVNPVPQPPLEPAMRVLPQAPARAKQAGSSTPFPPARVIPLSGHGAEDVVADAEGRLVCGVAGGRILRVDPATGSDETIGNTGGRPLGLEVLRDGRILVCDAQRGLLRLDPATGDLETLVHSIDDVPLRFCSNVTAARDGTYWFTESTSRFDFEHYLGAMLEHRPSGRLFRRDPDGHVETLLEGLHFANGVTLTEDEDALIFAETDGYRLSKLWLRGPRQGELEVIADNLPGFPDNLSAVRNGRLWTAMPNARQESLDKAGRLPGTMRKLAWKKMQLPIPLTEGTTWTIAFDTNGNIVADLQSRRTDFFGATGVVESGGKLYLSSADTASLLEVDLS